MVYPQLTALISQLGQHQSLGILLREDVGYNYRFSGFEVPDMDIVDVQNTIKLLELPAKLIKIDMCRS